MTYWLDLFTGETWRQFRDSGASISGFRENRWKQVVKLRNGDILFCYLTGISRWVGALEVVGEAFKDTTPIWDVDVFPARVRVRPLVVLDPEYAVPLDELGFMKAAGSHNRWGGLLRGSPVKLRREEGEALLQALTLAQTAPTKREFDPKKLQRRPRLFPVKKAGKQLPALVSVPEEESPYPTAAEPTTAPPESPHSEMQYLLLKLGSDMGLDVWVARNDKSRSWQGMAFSSIPRLRHQLPKQFDEATNRTIELIDVLWLRSNAIVAAFEVEHSTSIYSGLLRLSDLMSMQPNLNIKLYLVAPEDRREKVMTELARPTFSIRQRPLHQVCKFLSYETLKNRTSQLGDMSKYLRPEFLDEVSESCVVEA